MRLRHLSILFAAMALSACGGAQDAAPSTEAEASQQTPTADIAVEGPERRILAFGDSLFAGYGLEENEGYPEQLEDGGVLIVGAGSSGSQIADELLRSGRRTWLSIGPRGSSMMVFLLTNSMGFLCQFWKVGWPMRGQNPD